MFRANVVDMSPATLVLEATSSPGKLDALLAMLEAYGTCELVRTGRIALQRGSTTITNTTGTNTTGAESVLGVSADAEPADPAESAA